MIEIYLRREASPPNEESALVGRDFDQALWEKYKSPLTLLGAFHHYAWEWCRPKKVDTRRIGIIARHLVSFFPLDTDVEKMGRADFRLYEEFRLSRGVVSPTIRRELAFCKAALNHNSKWGRIQVVPKMEMPPQGQPRTRFLTEDEVARVMRQPMPYRIRMFFRLAFATAARATAIEQLTWDRVDFVNGLIDLRLPGVDHGRKRRAIVPISNELRPQLEAAYLRRTSELVIGPGCSTYKWCKAAMVSAGIAEWGVCRHVARKTWASQALQHGHALAKVAAFLGDNPTTVEKHYGFILPQHLIDVANYRDAA